MIPEIISGYYEAKLISVYVFYDYYSQESVLKGSSTLKGWMANENISPNKILTVLSHERYFDMRWTYAHQLEQLCHPKKKDSELPVLLGTVQTVTFIESLCDEVLGRHGVMLTRVVLGKHRLCAWHLPEKR